MLRPDPDDGGEGDFSTARVPHTQVAATAGNDTAWSSMAGWADVGGGDRDESPDGRSRDLHLESGSKSRSLGFRSDP